MGCCSCFIKFLSEFAIIILNSVLMLLSLVMIILGIIVLVSMSTLISWVASSTSNYDAQELELINGLLTFVSGYISIFGIFLLVAGIVFLMVSVFGCCGACCKSTCMMITYAILMFVVTALMLAFTIVFAVQRDVITDPANTAAAEQIQKNYNDPDNPMYNGNFSILDPVTAGLVVITREWDCCGMTAYTDYQKSTKWNRRYEYGNIVIPTAAVPVQCCRYKTRTPNKANGIDVFSPNDTTCLSTPTKLNSFIDTPCSSFVSNSVNDYFGIVIGIFAGITAAVFLLFAGAVFLSCQYYKKHRDEEYNASYTSGGVSIGKRY